VIRSKDDSDKIIRTRHHYTQAEVDGQIHYNLYDDTHVKLYRKIVEMFEAVDGSFYFIAQWYYRAEDMVEVNGHILYNLYDDAHVKAAERNLIYIRKIMEMFEAMDESSYFTTQWYYRVEDTISIILTPSLKWFRSAIFRLLMPSSN
ncbi:dna (cytosine-5)-methyltransferase cmt3, partial [Quercus suber]